MNKNTFLILGSLFILTSGLIYTIERLSSYVYWLAQTNTGSWDIKPDISIFNNIFTLLFLIIGMLLIVIAFKEKS
jgi:hypothetical protein